MKRHTTSYWLTLGLACAFIGQESLCAATNNRPTRMIFGGILSKISAPQFFSGPWDTKSPWFWAKAIGIAAGASLLGYYWFFGKKKNKTCSLDFEKPDTPKKNLPHSITSASAIESPTLNTAALQKPLKIIPIRPARIINVPTGPTLLGGMGHACGHNSQTQLIYSILINSKMRNLVNQESHKKFLQKYEEHAKNQTIFHPSEHDFGLENRYSIIPLSSPKDIQHFFNYYSPGSTHYISGIDKVTPETLNSVPQECTIVLLATDIKSTDQIVPTISTQNAKYQLSCIKPTLCAPSEQRYPRWKNGIHVVTYMHLSEGRWFHCSDDVVDTLETYDTMLKHLQEAGTILYTVLAYVKVIEGGK